MCVYIYVCIYVTEIWSYINKEDLFLFFVCLFVCFSGLQLWHMEVPMLGIEIRATAAGLFHCHSNAGSKMCLQPTSWLTATPDPQPTEQGHGLNLHPHGYWFRLIYTAPQQELPEGYLLECLYSTQLHRVAWSISNQPPLINGGLTPGRSIH